MVGKKGTEKRRESSFYAKWERIEKGEKSFQSHQIKLSKSGWIRGEKKSSKTYRLYIFVK